jgi:hypothetical protein
LRFRVFLTATFLTAALAWVEARGATGPEDTLLLGADFGEIGWPCIMTFFRGGEPRQKRTTGAGARNTKGEPSACMGVGPSRCCQEMKSVYRQITIRGYGKHFEEWYLVSGDVIRGVELSQ